MRMRVRANQKITSDLFIASRHAEVTENRINGKNMDYLILDRNTKIPQNTKCRLIKSKS